MIPEAYNLFGFSRNLLIFAACKHNSPSRPYAMQIGDVICINSKKIADLGTIFPDETYAQNDTGINGDYLVLGLILGDENTAVHVLIVPIEPTTNGEWLTGQVKSAETIVCMLLHSGVSGASFTLIFVHCFLIYVQTGFYFSKSNWCA